MWRSFFFAVGVGLMVLGAEALVFERFDIVAETPMPEFLEKIVQTTPSNPLAAGANSQFFDPNGSSPPSANGSGNRFNSAFANQVGGGQAYGSQFGPSRFSGPQSGNYGGGRVDLSRSGLTSDGRRNFGTAAYPISFSTPGTNVQSTAANTISPRGKRSIIVKDWMPWSLLASGAIIFLYTSSHRRLRE
jgi:hypothetical protein